MTMTGCFAIAMVVSLRAADARLETPQGSARRLTLRVRKQTLRT